MKSVYPVAENFSPDISCVVESDKKSLCPESVHASDAVKEEIKKVVSGCCDFVVTTHDCASRGAGFTVLVVFA